MKVRKPLASDLGNSINSFITAKDLERKELMRQRNVDFHVRKE